MTNIFSLYMTEGDMVVKISRFGTNYSMKFRVRRILDRVYARIPHTTRPLSSWHDKRSVGRYSAKVLCSRILYFGFAGS